MFEGFHYTPAWLIFRNEDDLAKALSLDGIDLNDLKEKGNTVSLKIGVKDLQFYGVRESEYVTSAEYVEVYGTM